MKIGSNKLNFVQNDTFHTFAMLIKQVNKKLSISKLLIGLFFLTIYGNVLFTQFVCNFSHLLESTASSHVHSDGHDHHHGKDAAPLAEHTHDDSHKHDDSSSSKDDNCCNEGTSAFFAHQTLPAKTIVDTKKIFSSDFVFTEATSFYFNPFVNTKGFAPSKSPPPKIPDIRVFTHSFLI